MGELVPQFLVTAHGFAMFRWGTEVGFFLGLAFAGGLVLVFGKRQ